MPNLILRDADMRDLHSIKDLYIDSARHYPDNLIPTENEITDEYVIRGLSLAIKTGFAIVLEKYGVVVGYIQGYPSQNMRECHLVKDTRVIIHSDYTSAGYAVKLMSAVRKKMDSMMHVKALLFNVRGHNTASAKCLKFFGCYELYRYQDALLRCDGTFMDDVIYKWDNPNFSIENFQIYWQMMYSVSNKNVHNVYVDGFKQDMMWDIKASSAGRYPS